MFMRWGGGKFFRQQRPCWCNVLGDGGGEAVSGGLCDPNRGVLLLQLSASRQQRSPNPPPAPPQNANARTSHSSPVPVFPFVPPSHPDLSSP